MTRPADFDSRERRSRRWTVVLAAGFYALCYLLCRFAYGPVLGFAVSSPVLGAFAAWWLLNRGGNGLRWFKWLALRDRDGRHHAFQDHPVDVRWHDGQCCLRARDAFAVLDEKPDETALRRLEIRFGASGFFQDDHGQWWFAEAAALSWLEGRAGRFEPEAQKFRLWLEREVFPPMRRRAALGDFQ